MGLDALLIGELVSENGCLRIRDIDGRDNYLLIWPNAAEMIADGQGVRVRDNSGASPSFHVGEEMEMGGGEAKFSHVQEIVRQPIPRDCPGPYWLVGEVSTTSATPSPTETPVPPSPTPAPAVKVFPTHSEPLPTDWGRHKASRNQNHILVELAVEEGCLRASGFEANNQPRPSYLLIWPAGYETVQENDEVHITDSSGTSC